MNARILAGSAALGAVLTLAGCSSSSRTAGANNPQNPVSASTAPAAPGPTATNPLATTGPASDSSDLAAVDSDLAGIDSATTQTDTDTSAADSAQLQSDSP